MSGRRNRTRSNATPAKPTQPSKPAAPPPKPTTSAPAKPAPTPPKATPPPPAKPTPSARLRQEWHSFETWLSARRAERDKRINEKLTEIMSSKGKVKKAGYGRSSTASESTDVGAFEDKLNEELAEQAAEEWFRRVEATGLEADDWTDMTEAEKAAVEAAFIPQQRSTSRNAAPEPSSFTPAKIPAAVATPAVVPPSKPQQAGRSPFAATVEDEPTPPGAWDAPQKSGAIPKGVIGRTRAETPILTKNSPLANGWGVNKGSSQNLPTADLLWEMHMNKNNAPKEPVMTESSWDMKKIKAATPAPPPIPAATKDIPSESPWESHLNRISPNASPSPNSWDKLVRENMTPAPQPEADDPWDVRTRMNGKRSQQQTPAPPTKPATPVFPTSKTPVPSKTPMPSKTPAPGKSNLGMSDSLWGSHISPNAPASSYSTSTEFPTPATSTFTGSYGYVSPLFVEMEDHEFPRIEDPLPDQIVDESIRQFYETAAEAEIDLRRRMISGALDESDMEQAVHEHLSMVEQHARKIVEQWRRAREVEIEERQAAEEKLRIIEEQKRRLAEAKRIAVAGSKKGKLGTPAPVQEPVVVARPASQAKKRQDKRGGGKNQAHLMEESFSARAATPSSLGTPGMDDIAEEDLWPPKPANKPSEGKSSMFSFFSKPSQTPVPTAPTPGPPTVSPWPDPPRAKMSSALKNPFFHSAKAPEREPTPWELVQAKKQETVPARAHYDEWAEDNTDESEAGTGAFWGQSALDAARGGAASVWNIASSALGSEPTAPPTKPVPLPSASARPATRQTVHGQTPPTHGHPWGGEDVYGRSHGAASVPGGFEVGSGAGGDSRFTTWRPATRPEPESKKSFPDPAKQMADLALENLMEIADEGDSPGHLLDAMSMYTKAMGSATRKRGNSNAQR